MKKKLLIISLILIVLLLSCEIGFAQYEDLTPAPGYVGSMGDCGDISIEFLDRPTTSTALAGLHAIDTFISMKVQLIYISDTLWQALDKHSFELINVSDGNGTVVPLDFVTSTYRSRSLYAGALADELVFPTLYNYYLVFDTKLLSGSWYLHFAPRERGSSDAPVCDLMLPIPAIYEGEWHEE